MLPCAAAGQLIINNPKCGSLSMPPAKELVMSKVETQITVNLPDGSQRSLDEGATGADLATSISQGLFRKSVGALLNGEIRDLYTPLADGDRVKILTADDGESLELLRHSTAHVMAEAV